MMRTLRYAVRQLLATPGFTAIAVVIVAVGIGATTAMFSTVDAVLLRPLALPEPDRLVAVYETNPERDLPAFAISVPNYVDFKARAADVLDLAAVYWRAMNLTGGGEPEMIQVRAMTANFLPTFGVTFALGRGFTEAEDRPGGAKVAVLSHGFWQRHFGGRRDIVGTGVRLDGDTYTVVGVTAPGLPLPGDIEIAIPAQFDVASESRMDHGLEGFGRLEPGVTLQEADQRLHAIAAEIAQQNPAAERGWRARIVPLREDLVGERLRRTLGVLLGAVGLLLLVACANLSNLLLVRASARGFELAVRRALGETRGRAIAQLLVESVLVTTIGGVLGIVVAAWSVDAIRTLPIERAAEIAVDLRVVGVALAATIVSGVLAGVGPAVRASRVAPQDALQAQGTRIASRSRFRDAMVVAQLALSLTLLVGAVLVARSFWRLLQVDPGFTTDRVVTLAMRPSIDAQAFYAQVGDRVRGLPGIDAAGLISSLPLGPGTTLNVFAKGPSRLAEGQSIQSAWRLVDGGYFAAMQIPLLRGRGFDGLAPEEAARAVVLSSRLARTLWGDADPIGKQIDPGGGGRLLTVIGVVGDVRNRSLATEGTPAFYWSFHRFVYGPMRLAVRSGRDTADVVAAVRREVRAVDPGAPIFQVRTMAEVRAESLSEERLLLGILWAFTGVALLLAALGTYGVVAFAVQQRTREFGIRVAMGAQAGHVGRLVLQQAAVLTGLGAAVGLAGAWLGSGLVGTLLFGVERFDVASYATATGVLGAVALLAAALPARRAARVNPVRALAGSLRG
jgi:putative ABC transport system permease protein